MNVRAWSLALACLSVGLLARCNSTTGSTSLGTGGSAPVTGSGGAGSCTTGLTSCAEALEVGGVPCVATSSATAVADYRAYAACAKQSCPSPCADLEASGASEACGICMQGVCASQANACGSN